MNNSITAIKGIRVGHSTSEAGMTGCTVILCPPNTVGGVDQRGGAPGTRETDLLRPMHLVQHVHALALSGGSAYGLAVADGVMRYCEEQGIGYPVPPFVVPIVPTAILMDLYMGDPTIRPNADMGYQACLSASSEPVTSGNIGAGMGCRVGGLFGNPSATKGGLGSSLIRIDDELMVGALVAVNAVGDVVDEQGHIIAGIRNPDGSFMGMLNAMRGMARMTPPDSSNTVIGVVVTNAKLTKEAVNKVAQMAQDGLAQAIRPAHTLFDGDTIFALATGEIEANVSVVGAFATEAMASAIRDAVKSAKTLGDVRAWDVI
ncbi:MAG: peptidase S58 [Phototrophicales bacterium]|nr:MAG: peptidase S58 [Phototrophicales bacterium]